MSKADAVLKYPNFPWLSLDDPAGVENFLKERGWLDASEAVRTCEKPGDGNMNLTIRVRTDRRNLIVKQARPWVKNMITSPRHGIEYSTRFDSTNGSRASRTSPATCRGCSGSTWTHVY